MIMISIIALWANMLTRLWIPIKAYSVMVVHYGYPWYSYPQRWFKSGYPNFIMDIYNSIMDIHNYMVYSHFPYHHYHLHYHRHYHYHHYHHHHHHHHHHLTILQSNITRYLTQKFGQIWTHKKTPIYRARNGGTKGVFFSLFWGKTSRDIGNDKLVYFLLSCALC